MKSVLSVAAEVLYVMASPKRRTKADCARVCVYEEKRTISFHYSCRQK